MSDVLFDAPVQSRETDERYTPSWIFEALGESFDLDPASPPLGVSRVPTTAVWTKDDDGLTQPWHGFVWLNPPFSHSTAWADRFMAHGDGIWLGPVANSDWHCRMMRTSDAMILMRDFPFLAPTHAGKRSSLPLSMHAFGARAVTALHRFVGRVPDAGVLVQRVERCRRPRLLDLFGGAQGSGVGYARAGFDVTSVDNEYHDKHILISATVVRDAMDVLTDHAFLAGFDVIHAGPPCQGYTTMNRWRGKTPGADRTPRLIGQVRQALRAWGGVYVIENVPGARPVMLDPIRLRGGHFGLGVDRPRLFEASVPLLVPAHTKVPDPLGVCYGPLDGRRLFTRKDGSIQRAPKTLAQAQAAMGIDWMSWDDLREAVPPAYTEHIGRQLLALPSVCAA